ncbi:glycosyl hydrolase family 28 protein [Xanthobacter sp. KR7-65]|uniref:glycosyl hydrolase family 28 protein n=1 Tax=Xanthobacter sp. KR7-65 TaxID=3156612 RepID=UPI0032B3F753
MQGGWMLKVMACLGISLGVGLGLGSAQAQDSRPEREPTFPTTCEVVRATLSSSPDGPSGLTTAEAQNNASKADTARIEKAITKCAGSGNAVELALGTTGQNAFLVNPLKLPKGTSLIIDGGVTVYASRNAEFYQNPKNPDIKCSSLRKGDQNDGCLPVISLSSQTGVYGYGVIDGQGDKPIIQGSKISNTSWWGLESNKDCPGIPAAQCLQEAPILIMGPEPQQPLLDQITLYKITLRNPPFHNVLVGATNLTAWGVKVQAPWTIGNTAGFVIHGNDILIREATISAGDQDIVVEPSGPATTNVTIRDTTVYSRGGVNVASLYTDGVDHILIENFNMTGDLPSVVGTTVNGVPESVLKQQYNLKSYGQALPNAASLYGLQITTLFGEDNGKPFKRAVRNVMFDKVCLQDVQNAIYIGQAEGQSGSGSSSFPTIEGVTFRNIHVLKPTAQFPALSKGIPTGGPGSYLLTLVADPPHFSNHLTLDNVVIDDISLGKTSLSGGAAIGNVLTTKRVLYPPSLNQLDRETAPPGWSTAKTNAYDPPRTPLTVPVPAHGCPDGLWPFLTGELFVSADVTSVGSATNLTTATAAAGADIVLNAVLQPAMTETTDFRPKGYGADPGLVAVGSPRLTNSVTFYDNGRKIGTGMLGANGTLATFRVRGIARGLHRFTAYYPPDAIYKGYRFGSAVVTVR